MRLLELRTCPICLKVIDYVAGNSDGFSYFEPFGVGTIVLASVGRANRLVAMGSEAVLCLICLGVSSVSSSTTNDLFLERCCSEICLLCS